MKKFTIHLMDMTTDDFPMTFPEILIEADDIIEKTYGHEKWKDGHEDVKSYKKRLIIKNLRKVEARGRVEDFENYKEFYEGLKAAVGHDVVVKYKVIDIYNPKSGWWSKNVQDPVVEVKERAKKSIEEYEEFKKLKEEWEVLSTRLIMAIQKAAWSLNLDGEKLTEAFEEKLKEARRELSDIDAELYMRKNTVELFERRGQE